MTADELFGPTTEEEGNVDHPIMRMFTPRITTVQDFLDAVGPSLGFPDERTH